VKNLGRFSNTKQSRSIMKSCRLLCRCSIWRPVVILHIYQRCLSRFAPLHLGSPCFPSLWCWKTARCHSYRHPRCYRCCCSTTFYISLYRCMLISMRLLSNEFMRQRLIAWSLIFPVFVEVVSDGQCPLCSASARHVDSKEEGRGVPRRTWQESDCNSHMCRVKTGLLSNSLRQTWIFYLFYTGFSCHWGSPCF